MKACEKGYCPFHKLFPSECQAIATRFYCISHPPYELSLKPHTPLQVIDGGKVGML